jgi:hypothetical protein
MQGETQIPQNRFLGAFRLKHQNDTDAFLARREKRICGIAVGPGKPKESLWNLCSPLSGGDA